jgi:putative lipoic acid-binding regulatory protein
MEFMNKNARNLDEIIEYPLDFPIKIMGKFTEGFVPVVTEIVKRHAPDWDPDSIQTRPSSKGTYQSVTATIVARDRAQLDALYIELTAHPMIAYVL